MPESDPWRDDAAVPPLRAAASDELSPSLGHPSRTSQLVAFARAEFVRPHTPEGDPDAQRRLCDGMRPPPEGWRRPDLAARTRFFDEQVLGAISSGVRQVVILGAGYDDRALRFSSAGVRYFELDHPVTQADKEQRLRSLLNDVNDTDRLVLVPADFRDDEVGACLAASGHDAAAPSLFICEGLLVYLEQAIVVRLLAALRGRAVPGTSLAASLAVHADGADPGQVLIAANARRRTGTSEPWRTILPTGAHLDLLARAGWHVEHVVDAAGTDRDAPPNRSLFVVARPAEAPARP
jgi:methyltransferase (TIGR00027 family)